MNSSTLKASARQFALPTSVNIVPATGWAATAHQNPWSAALRNWHCWPATGSTTGLHRSLSASRSSGATSVGTRAATATNFNRAVLSRSTPTAGLLRISRSRKLLPGSESSLGASCRTVIALRGASKLTMDLFQLPSITNSCNPAASTSRALGTLVTIGLRPGPHCYVRHSAHRSGRKIRV